MIEILAEAEERAKRRRREALKLLLKQDMGNGLSILVGKKTFPFYLIVGVLFVVADDGLKETARFRALYLN